MALRQPIPRTRLFGLRASESEFAIAAATAPEVPRGAAETDSESAAVASAAGGATAKESFGPVSASESAAPATPATPATPAAASPDPGESSTAFETASPESAQLGRVSAASSVRDGLPLSTRVSVASGTDSQFGRLRNSVTTSTRSRSTSAARSTGSLSPMLSPRAREYPDSSEFCTCEAHRYSGESKILRSAPGSLPKPLTTSEPSSESRASVRCRRAKPAA